MKMKRRSAAPFNCLWHHDQPLGLTLAWTLTRGLLIGLD